MIIGTMRIQWVIDAHISSRSVLDYFLTRFPTHMLADFAFWASTMLKDAGQTETTPQEILKVFGFLYGVTVHPYEDRRNYRRVERMRIPAWGV